MRTAPWTAEQVEALNEFQRLGYMHEFTCPNNHQSDRVLVAHPHGWQCPSCDYVQDWAHDFMADKALHPPHPFASIKAKFGKA